MTDPAISGTPHEHAPEELLPPETATQKLSALSSLLSKLDEAPRTGEQALAEGGYENKLIQVRLGVASALFIALRAKHAPTALHSLRVALGCSSWALTMDLEDEIRDEIEVAALLHDIGKIGVPDTILAKPAKLSHDEATIVDQHRKNGLEILTACCASKKIIDAVYFASAWFDGSKKRFDRKSSQLPIGSRMIAIVDAFDAMTTDHVYRRAMSRERAIAELFECAGTQFDPGLVKNFCALMTNDHVKLSTEVARRWLRELHSDSSNSLWCLSRLAQTQRELSVDHLFQQKLVDSMHDAVVFVDSSMTVMLWNRAAERLTGIRSAGLLQRHWAPSLVQMRDEKGNDVPDGECPVAYVMKSTVQTMRRLTITGRGGQHIAVDAHLVPVISREGVVHGATLLMHDASSQITLEERVETLHVRATQDPLTGVSNRAEFDRVHAHFVDTHLELGLPCSLIICDLDYFKQVNDTFGHQAGDDALVSFATLLKRFCRQGDLVARYGGEEFVMLCADCDNTTATKRAEDLRSGLESTPQEALGGKAITASFGVTEIQAGDKPETMLRRADRALLQAKDLGRNTVVQLGSGISDEDAPKKSNRWMSWLKSAPPDQIMQRILITAVPLKVVVEKLRGFVADHHAEIISIADDHVILKIDGEDSRGLRRRNDRIVPFIFELNFDESEFDNVGRTGGKSLRTIIEVAIRPIRNRDRRRRNAVGQARQLLASLKSYLMAQDFVDALAPSNPVTGEPGVLNKAKQILKPIFKEQPGEE